jgi:hypothetical protein
MWFFGSVESELWFPEGKGFRQLEGILLRQVCETRALRKTLLACLPSYLKPQNTYLQTQRTLAMTKIQQRVPASSCNGIGSDGRPASLDATISLTVS